MTQTAFERQVGGTHYRDLAIQPIMYSEANKLTPLAHSIIKYATRAGRKGTKEDHKKDIEKIVHCAELWLEIHYPTKCSSLSRPHETDKEVYEALYRGDIKEVEAADYLFDITSKYL